MSVPATVRSSMLIQFSPDGSDLNFPRDKPGPAADAITAGGIPLATGRNPSVTASRGISVSTRSTDAPGCPFPVTGA